MGIMYTTFASEAGSGGANQDWAGGTSFGLAVLLDGLSEGPESGCHHGTAWYVRRLGGCLLEAASNPSATLRRALADSIRRVAAAHRDTCDLTHRGSPAATVAAVRRRGDTLEYLVLSDSVALIDTGDDLRLITDQTVGEHLRYLIDAAEAGGAGSAAYQALIEAQQRLRNAPGGYWVAQVDPAAAEHALTGEVDGATGAMLLSDGAARLVTDFAALAWRELLDLAYQRGPAELIAVTRELERRDRDRTVWPRYRTHDDATVVLCQTRWAARPAAAEPLVSSGTAPGR